MPIPDRESLHLACSRFVNLPEAERISRAEPARQIPFNILLQQRCNTPPLLIPEHLRQAEFRPAVAAEAELIGTEHTACKPCAVKDSIRCQNRHCTERRTHNGHSN
jgi:hypothetical protein